MRLEVSHDGICAHAEPSGHTGKKLEIAAHGGRSESLDLLLLVFRGVGTLLRPGEPCTVDHTALELEHDDPLLQPLHQCEVLIWAGGSDAADHGRAAGGAALEEEHA